MPNCHEDPLTRDGWGQKCRGHLGRSICFHGGRAAHMGARCGVCCSAVAATPALQSTDAECRGFCSQGTAPAGGGGAPVSCRCCPLVTLPGLVGNTWQRLLVCHFQRFFFARYLVSLSEKMFSVGHAKHLARVLATRFHM